MSLYNISLVFKNNCMIKDSSYHAWIGDFLITSEFAKLFGVKQVQKEMVQNYLPAEHPAHF
jgi:hypothetical protein